MIYILVMVFMVDRGGAVIQQEFNSLEACRAASKVIWQQAPERYSGNLTVMKNACVAKGEKK